MAKQATPVYIKNLLKPPASQPSSDRRVWSIPLAGVWLPFFVATNTVAETAIAADVLGAPLRLAREQDGTPKFSSKGKPVVRVVKELADQVRLVRENFVAGLMQYAASVQKAMPDEYKAQVEVTRKAGIPIVEIGYEDEDTLYFDLFDSALAADTPEGNECIASVMLNLKTGKATIVHCGGDK